MRSAVVLVQEGKVALIRRERKGMEYFLFPGGQVEAGETLEQAAIREAMEELGVEVQIESLIAQRDLEPKQAFFSARIVGGKFGSGHGEELTSLVNSERGSYTPVWVASNSLDEVDIRPRSLATSIRLGLVEFVEVTD